MRASSAIHKSNSSDASVDSSDASMDLSNTSKVDASVDLSDASKDSSDASVGSFVQKRRMSQLSTRRMVAEQPTMLSMLPDY
jgi:hypothetical protein